MIFIKINLNAPAIFANSTSIVNQKNSLQIEYIKYLSVNKNRILHLLVLHSRLSLFYCLQQSWLTIHCLYYLYIIIILTTSYLQQNINSSFTPCTTNDILAWNYVLIKNYFQIGSRDLWHLWITFKG